MMAYKLLALDMDGTLLTSDKRISARTREALRNLAERGTPVAYCTGRCFKELLEYPQELPFVRYGVLSSGAIVYDFEICERLAVRPLDTDAILCAMEIARVEDAMVHVMAVEASVTRADDIARMGELGMGVYRSMFERICTLEDDPASWAAEHAGEVVKVNFYHKDPSSRDRTRRRIEQARLPLALANAEATSVECSASGVSKAKGLQTLAEYLGISLNEVVAVGDSDNDVEALGAVGMPVAMGNATDAVRGLARLVVASNDEDGIVEVVERLF